jgi:hypothetical protein
MKPLSYAGRIGALALAATALIAGPAFAAPAHHRAAAVFVQTDDVHRNAIVAYDRAADGTLRRAGTYPTGGRGGILDGSVVDHSPPTAHSPTAPAGGCCTRSTRAATRSRCSACTATASAVARCCRRPALPRQRHRARRPRLRPQRPRRRVDPATIISATSPRRGSVRPRPRARTQSRLAVPCDQFRGALLGLDVGKLAGRLE